MPMWRGLWTERILLGVMVYIVTRGCFLAELWDLRSTEILHCGILLEIFILLALLHFLKLYYRLYLSMLWIGFTLWASFEQGFSLHLGEYDNELNWNPRWQSVCFRIGEQCANLFSQGHFPFCKVQEVGIRSFVMWLGALPAVYGDQGIVSMIASP